VSLWKLRKEKKYIPDVSELEGLVKENTKMIIINNPNNPTGSTIPKSVLQDLIKFASERDIIILSDEVYRPLFHGTLIRLQPLSKSLTKFDSLGTSLRHSPKFPVSHF
jgi:aspartate/methionine/tyrosine aminotransferase